jgi:Flp pilus assembly protein TadB
MEDEDFEFRNELAHISHKQGEDTMQVRWTRAFIAQKKREAQRHRRTFIAVLLIAAFYLTVPVAAWTKLIAAVFVVLALWCIHRLTMHVRYWKQAPPAD